MKKMKLFSTEDLKTLTQFVKNEIIPYSHARDESATYPLELMKQLHTLGWTRAFIPTEFGGLGASSEDLVHIYREIAYGSPGMALSIAANMTALLPILLAGSPEIRQSVAEDYQNRFSLNSFCFTEANHGSDVFSNETAAKKVEGGYVLTGQKNFITNVNHAERYLIVAKTESVGNPRAMSLFLIEGRPAGFSVGTPYSMMGLRDSNTGEIFLDQVFVPDSHRIGAEGEGFKIAALSIRRSRTMLAAAAIGLCSRALDLAKEYLRTRNHHGKSLLFQPAVSNLFSQLQAELEAAWLLVQAAARGWDDGDESFKLSSMAKLLSGQLASKTASACVELFGGFGCTKEYEIERLYREAKFFEILEGPNFVQLAIIARELMEDVKSSAKPSKAA